MCSMITSTHKIDQISKKDKMNWHFCLIYNGASPKHDLDTMFQYINFIPIHKPHAYIKIDQSYVELPK